MFFRFSSAKLVRLHSLRKHDLGESSLRVKRDLELERRRDHRFPHEVSLQLQEVPPHGGPITTKSFSARVQNVSQGGICVISEHSVLQASLVRCEIPVSDTPLNIATLMVVRWTQKQNLCPEGYLTGLQFFL